MKITSVKALTLRWPCPISSDAMSVNQIRQALLIQIETDTDIKGIGEAFCYGSPLAAGKAIIEQQLAPILKGQDPTNIEKLWNTMFWRVVANGRNGVTMGCISGIDIALWDILGKAAKMPVYKLLGAHQDKVATYASGGFYAPGKNLDGLQREVEGYLKQGYHDVKIKIGRDPEMPLNSTNYTASHEFPASYEEDLRRIEKVRQTIGPKGWLGADINTAWPADTVVEAADDFAKAGLNCLEEPILFEDEVGLVKIRQAMSKIRLMGYETMQGARNWKRLLVKDCMDVVQPDIGWGGGFSELRKICLMAHAFSKPVSLHSFGSAVHFAASLHLAASLPNSLSLESEENPNRLKSELLINPLIHDENMNFFIPNQPGLGIELNPDTINDLAVNV